MFAFIQRKETRKMKTYVVPIVSVVAAIALLMASWTPVLANGGRG